MYTPSTNVPTDGSDVGESSRVLVMPRMLSSWSRGDPAVSENDGTALARSSALNTFSSARFDPLYAEMAIGVVCSDVSRRWAVTTISSRPCSTAHTGVAAETARMAATACATGEPRRTIKRVRANDIEVPLDVYFRVRSSVAFAPPSRLL